MSSPKALAVGENLIDLQLFEIGGTPVTVATLIVFGLLLLLSIWAAMLLERLAAAAMRRRGVRDEGSIKAVGRLTYYVMLLVGFGIAFNTAGFNLSALFAAGAVFAVGLGFAFQNLAQNFVSGVLLLVEQTITPGDVLEVEGRTVRVVEMRMRTTVARTRDEEDFIIPNSVLAQGMVKNLSLDDSIYRLRVSVGVSYSSDMALVRRTLEAVGEAVSWRLVDRTPAIELSEFGASAVIWDLSVWTDDPWRSRTKKAELNEMLWWALKAAGIAMAFPQLDVHFDALPRQGGPPAADQGLDKRSVQ